MKQTIKEKLIEWWNIKILRLLKVQIYDNDDITSFEVIDWLFIPLEDLPDVTTSLDCGEWKRIE